MSHRPPLAVRPAAFASPAAALALLAAALLLLACGGADEAAAPTAPQVTVASPERREIVRYADFTGTTRAIEYAEIRARVPGTLDAMHFTPSTFVGAGDILFEIEPEIYQAAYDEAVAEVAAADAQLAQARSDLERVEIAAKSRAVSQQDLDLARTKRDQASASVMTARARLSEASTNLGYTEVKTPIAGQVGRNLVDIGNLVGSGDATLLTTVTKIQPIYVYFHAPERGVLGMLTRLDEERGRPRAGDPNDAASEEPAIETTTVLVGTAASKDFPHVGEIDYVDNTVDPSTGTIELRAVLPNARQILFPGLFVRVRVLSGEGEEAVVVDERGIGTDLGGKFVYVLEDGNVVAQRYVELGPLQEDGAIVVEEGLDGSETYIVNGMLRARPGFPVTPQTAEEAAAAKAQQSAAAKGG